MIKVRVHSEEWFKENAYQNRDGLWGRAPGEYYKLLISPDRVGKLFDITKYGDTTTLGIPEWGIEKTYYLETDPEYFV